MSPTQDRSTDPRNQAQDKQRKRRGQRQPRSRECLLKGCGRGFRPRYPTARYCSAECRRKARQWSQWKSRQRWRRSENGRKKRQQQSVRHRERLLASGRSSTAGASGCAWVITSRKLQIFFADTCDRPGCYEGFSRTRRSPLQRFCSHDCRRALERVRERERRWRERGYRRRLRASSGARARTSRHIVASRA
jgi:hypothetical protein